LRTCARKNRNLRREKRRPVPERTETCAEEDVLRAFERAIIIELNDYLF